MKFAPAIRVITAAAMLLSPTAAARAQQPAAAGSYLTSESVASLSLRPKQILENPMLELLPIEVAQAAGKKYLGMDPTSITRITVVAEPPLGATPYYAVVAESEKPWSFDSLALELIEHTRRDEIAGRECLVSQQPMLPCYTILDRKTLVVASEGMLEKLLDGERPKAEGLLVDLVEKKGDADDAYLAVDLEALRPLLQLGMMAARQETPPEYQEFLEIPSLIESVELTLNLGADRASSLIASAGDAEDAERLEELYDGLMETVREQAIDEMQDEIARLRSSDDAVERSLADYLDRISKTDLTGYRPQRSGDSFVLFEARVGDANPAFGVATVGVLVALLLPAVQAAREAARRNQSMNNLKQVNLAMHNYHDVSGSFPAHAIYSDDGEPLLSWRVAILPYVEELPLYNKFNLDEPWDSENNKKLIERMPDVYLDPSSGLATVDGKTHYLGVKGEGLFFSGEEGGNSFRNITDGTSKSIAIVQVGDEEAVTWTKPEDFTPDARDPLAGIGFLHPAIFNAGFADGHVSAISYDIDPDMFWKLLTINGREVVDHP